MAKAAISIRVQDGDVQALAAKLAALSRTAAKQALRAGMNEVTREVLKEVKSNTPRGRGQLRKSMGRVVRVLRSGKGVLGKVGPRSGYRIMVNGKPVDPIRYAHIVEYGRKALTPKKKKVMADAWRGGSGWQGTIFGKRVRAVAPTGFMRRSWDAVRSRVTGILTHHLKAGIRKFWTKRGVSSAAA